MKTKIKRVSTTAALRAALGNRKLRDATETMDVVVTPGDWKNGKREDRAECAVALAIRAAGSKYEGALVSRTKTYVLTATEAVRYHNGARMMQDIIKHFDRGRAPRAPKMYRLFAPKGRRRLGHSQAPMGRRDIKPQRNRGLLTGLGLHRIAYSQR